MSQFSGFAIKQQTDVKTARGAVRSRAAAGFDDDDYGEEEEKTEFISSFDTETKKKDEVNLPVIPCIPNSFQTGEKIKLNNAEDEEPKEKKANRTAEEDATKAKSEKVVETSPVDEDEEALNAILQDAADFESMRLKEDLENCPDMEEGQYSNVTIETFGEAMLRGMGWEKGKAYGKYGNEVVEPMEYIPRHHRLGLGANPEAAEDKLKEKADRRKYIKPGETREPKKFYGLAPGEDGRVRHHRGLNEKLVEIKAARIEAGNPVLVTRGPHEDLYGLIDSLGETSCRVRLAISKEVVKIKTSHLKAIAAHEYKALGRPVRKVKTGTRPNNPSPSPPLPAESGNSSERRSRNSRREERGGEKGRGRGGRSEREKEKGRESRYDSRHREARKEKEGRYIARHLSVLLFLCWFLLCYCSSSSPFFIYLSLTTALALYSPHLCSFLH
eukprot:GCRY01003269.1.p1 GENE.GCRY01003269.1~~GCRY01003269.1.p1  ORF type:complete len:443 (+),score=111.02 GCRY01003269.1:120-1448(+)